LVTQLIENHLSAVAQYSLDEFFEFLSGERTANVAASALKPVAIGRNLISSLQCGFRTNATKPTGGAGDEAYFFKMWMFLLILIGCLTASDS
jgi:hypothetical protein